MSQHFNDVVKRWLTRREWMRMVGLATGAAVLACDERAHLIFSGTHAALGFTPVPKSLADVLTVPDGYTWKVVHALGDPLLSRLSAWSGTGTEEPESYEHRVGDGHDGMNFFGLAEDCTLSPMSSIRGLLCVSHEYVVAPFALHPNGKTVSADERRV